MRWVGGWLNVHDCPHEVGRWSRKSPRGQNLKKIQLWEDADFHSKTSSGLHFWTLQKGYPKITLKVHIFNLAQQPKPLKCLFWDQKCLDSERKFGVGGFMNVHVDIGRWSMKCPYLSTWGEWVVRKGQNLVHMVFECPLGSYILCFDVLCFRWADL